MSTPPISDSILLSPFLHLTNDITAIRGRRPPTPRPFPSPRLGDPYPCDSHPRGHRCGRQLPERRYDQEWEEEGCEGEGKGGSTREEEELGFQAVSHRE